MKFGEFFRRYGGSFRTKHLHKTEEGAHERRGYVVPRESEIPAEFIRLEPWEGEYLFMLAQRAKVGILEIGRFHGGSTFLFTAANPNIPLYSIDLAPKNDDLLKELLQRNFSPNRTHLIVGDSQRERSPHVGEFDLLFIDGDHSYSGCTNDILNWFPMLRVGGHVVLHDSYCGSEVLDSTADFIESHRSKVDVVVWPFRGAHHADHHAGSLAHLIKRA